MVQIMLIFVLIFSIAIGVVFTSAPRWAIHAQIAFYRLINWKMEPVSWKLEIRNTRWMGIIALVTAIGACFVLFNLLGK